MAGRSWEAMDTARGALALNPEHEPSLKLLERAGPLTARAQGFDVRSR